MPRSLVLVTFVTLPVLFASAPRPAVQPPDRPQQHASPLAIVVDAKGDIAFVALHGRAAVAVVDLKAGKVLKEIAVDAGPYDLAATEDTVYVTCTDGDSLVLIDRAKHTVQKKVAIGQAPRGVAVVAKHQLVFAACRDEQALHWLDESTGKIDTAPLSGFPDRLAATPDGVAVTAVVQRGGQWAQQTFSVRGGKVEAAAILHHTDAGNVRGLADVTGKPGMVAVAQRPRSNVPATQVAHGWVFVNCLLWTNQWEQPHANLALDEPQCGFADPSDVVRSPDKKRLYVVSAGIDSVLVIDTLKLLQTTEELKKLLDLTGDYGGYHGRSLPDDLTLGRRFIVGRAQVQANPRRLALSGDGKVLVASNHLADSLTVIDTATMKVVRHIDLGGPVPDAARRGEILFNSAKLTFHTQFSCASCHPDGGSDGLNWDLPRDGVGNALNSRSLLGVKDTGPYGWHGSSPTLADRAAGTLRTLHQHEPTEQEIADLVAYLKSLKFPRPLPQPAGVKDAVARGKAVFDGKGGCAKCHRGDTFQDGLTHDIGTRQPGDIKGTFDTPSLRGVARTAPYLHHGKAATLEEVFTRHNPDQRHGAGHTLTESELKDVVLYLRSL